MSSQVIVAVAQINCTVGDLEGNSRRIVDAARRAAAAHADILLTPELSLTGYPPEDLLLRRAFYGAVDAALAKLAAQLLQFPELTVIVGHPLAREGQRFNAASLLHEGRVAGSYCKHDLPNYDVFDEQRYFTPDNRPFVFDVKGTRFGINICEDTWYPYAPEAARAAGAQVLLVPNGSPYHLGKTAQRLDKMRENVSRAGLPMVYANLVGGQDELVFDGASFVLDAGGGLVRMAPQFEEHVLTARFVDGAPEAGEVAEHGCVEAQAYGALRLGVHDYLGKNGFPGAVIGLSGGIDSALTLAIACDALGPERVRAVMMPSQFTADISWLDSRQMVEGLNVRYDELPIKPVFDSFLATLAREFSIVLTTGNKSEMAVGYATLYGDMAGGFAVIKDIRKTLVYRLAHWRNGVSPVIPERIITRPPSAELRPNQTDQDSLPAYDVLDGIIELYMEQGASLPEVVAAGYSPADVNRVVRLIRVNEYKRRQAPVGIRVTHRGFGRDWRYPITNRFREEVAP